MNHNVSVKDTIKIQTLLQQQHRYTGRIDGDYGPLTEEAVRAFQASHGLVADGDVGPITAEAMNIKLEGAAAFTPPGTFPSGGLAPSAGSAGAAPFIIESSGYMTWLPGVLQAAGLSVSLRPGWETRGHGGMGPVCGVLCHHTACGHGFADRPSEGVVTDGRSDLMGPLCNLLLGREGDYEVIAAGKAWHAGDGIWGTVPRNCGNPMMIGIEAENAGDGSDPWPEVQVEAYAKGVAALLKHIGAEANMCAGHKEYCIPAGRKIDPDFDMDMFRTRVAKYMAG